MLASVVYGLDMDKRIEIVQATATVIEPGKKYILQVKDEAFTADDAKRLNDTLHKWGAEGVTVMYGDKPMELIEVQDA